VIAALAGVILFSEPITTRLAVSSVLVLGGVAIAVRGALQQGRRRSRSLSSEA